MGQERNGSVSLPAPAPATAVPVAPFSSIGAFRAFVFTTFEDPQFSTLAKCFNIGVLVLILFSTSTFLLETLPELDPANPAHDEARREYLYNFWATCETVVVAIFTAEYLIRLLCCPALLPFVTNKLNIVDVLAVFPYYVELILDKAGADSGSGVSNLRFLRTIRLFRVFRLFKLSKHSEHFVVFVETLRKSRDALLMLTFILALTVIIFAGIMHILEKAQYDPVTKLYIREDGTKVAYDPFRSVPEAAWWAIATLTTVGYGDAVPVTGPGKAVAPIAMLAGILTIAMPLGIIGENLMESYRRSAKLSNPQGDSLMASANEEPASLLEMVALIGQTREEIAFLFCDLEDTILRLRKETAHRDAHAFNHVEQCMFDNVIRGLTSLEAHLVCLSEEFGEVDPSRDLDPPIKTPTPGDNPSGSRSPARRLD